MKREDYYQERRNDYDVTNSVQVSSPAAVRHAVEDIFVSVYPHASFDSVCLAFLDFERFFAGLDPRYHGVDTTYHDVQHTLDMTLALARLVAGYERSVAAEDRLGAERAALGLITALFHDSGYLRHRELDRASANGAAFTLTHVSRSAAFLRDYLPTIGLERNVPIATQIVHFTGYELSLDSIELDEPKDSTIGHLLGTADLIAQMADRCYLEKCRDRLFAEFVLAGIAIESRPTGTIVRYRSGRDLLAKTLSFYERSARERLEHSFNRAYRYLETYFEDENPYVIFIKKNLDHLTHVIESAQWEELRRRPPCFIPDPRGEARITALALKHIQSLAAADKIALKGMRELTPVYAG
ncbi:MAG TPA: hypothetical protein VLD39_02365 [Gammaproteobacteria bacterium]|nr:hypothetical protein [Gammaproteobacteria bacterium]